MKFSVTHDRLSMSVRGDIRLLRQNAWDVLRAVSLAGERRIKNAMPVRTGRARASWGHWTPGDLRQVGAGHAGDSAWEEDKEDLSITQGSNVEYILKLNAGTSRQAPAGFIDAAEEKMARELDVEIDRLIGRFTLE